MAPTCSCFLSFNGEASVVLQINQKLKDNPSLISDLERQGFPEDGAFDDIDILSSPPTTSLSSGEPWGWESIRYPSMLGVLNLSRQYPEVAMCLNYEDDDDFVSIDVYIKNGRIISELDFVLATT